MKRLVKTAKQQFEERLNFFGNPEPQNNGTEVFYHCVDADGNFHLLRIGDDCIEYSEFVYGCKLSDIYSNEKFLFELVADFIEDGRYIKPLLDWYASADRNEPPFDATDIINNFDESEFIEYSDIYEEIPDLKTAQDKFNERLKEVGLWDDWEGQCCCGRIGIELDNEIVIFVHESACDGYSEYHYPSFEELRNNEQFRFDCLDEFSESESDFISNLVCWLTGRSDRCPLDPVEVYFAANSLINQTKSVDFKDDQPEQSVEEMLKLTEKQLEAVRMIEEGVRLLYSNGGKIFQNFDDNVYYAVNAKNLEFQTTNWEHEKMKNRGYSDVSFIVSKQKLDFCNDYWATDGSLFAKKSK